MVLQRYASKGYLSLLCSPRGAVGNVVMEPLIVDEHECPVFQKTTDYLRQPTFSGAQMNPLHRVTVDSGRGRVVSPSYQGYVHTHKIIPITTQATLSEGECESGGDEVKKKARTQFALPLHMGEQTHPDEGVREGTHKSLGLFCCQDHIIIFPNILFPFLYSSKSFPPTSIPPPHSAREIIVMGH